MTKQTTETTAPVVAPKQFTVGKFNFAIRTGVAIPTDIPKAPNPNALPFKDHFSDMADRAEMFVPTAFWTGAKADGGREVAADKVTIAYVKNKLRDQFKDWQGKDAEGRKGFSIVMVPRLGTEEGYTEAGMSLFLLHPEKAPA